jgi:hypothetical protein
MVARKRGKPKRCEECGTTDPKKTYDWANQKGRYDDPQDYRRLCRSCHGKLDAQSPPRYDTPPVHGTSLTQYVPVKLRTGMGTEIPCACECGGTLPQFDKNGRARSFLKGHYLKWVTNLRRKREAEEPVTDHDGKIVTSMWKRGVLNMTVRELSDGK